MKFVDAKGRDCTRTHAMLLLSSWDTCEEDQEALAVTRQEIKLDADVKNKKEE